MIIVNDCSTGEIAEENHPQAYIDGKAAITAAEFEQSRREISVLAEDIFYQLASKKTGEPINALIIQEWQAKEMLVKQWVAAGKPVPMADNDYALSYYEAQGDPDKTPAELMETWLVNATNWRILNIDYIAWRQSFRAQVKAATSEADLEALRASIEPTLRTLLGLG